ncbi:uncharacterized protein SAPINGB_P003147 [Magnusiomyces paraingens]|uniref:Uncharacterized protein n=1 Tax=Magnusiomyces paraingens TaxID=2606893 RepID=A0A5E8BK03_9ASCO|nr:uncharacterized protein SAPINGB_P003147 [Saprochaete ingens]VVT51591.1 unnamed protein product [Saprochaete ingens]
MKNYRFASIDNPNLYRFSGDLTNQFKPGPGHEFGKTHLEFLIDLYNFVFKFNESGGISVRQYLQILESYVPSNIWFHPYVQKAPVHLKIPILFSLSYTMDMRAKDFQAYNFDINLQDRYADEYHHLYNHMWESSLVNRVELDLMKITTSFMGELNIRLPSFFDSKTGLVSEEIRILNQKAVQLEDTNAKTLVYSFYSTFRQTFRYLSYKHNISGAALFAQTLPEPQTPNSPYSLPISLAESSVLISSSFNSISLMNRHTPPLSENSPAGSKKTKRKIKKPSTPSPINSSLSLPKEVKEHVSSSSGANNSILEEKSCDCNKNTSDASINKLDSDDFPNYIATSSKSMSINAKDAIPRKFDDVSESR